MWQHPTMSRSDKTIWQRLEECVDTLHEPFSRSEIQSWFRRHYPETNETSVSAHIQYARSDAPSRGAFASRTPLISQVGYGLYQRYRGPGGSAATSPAPQPPAIAIQPPLERDEPARPPSGVEDRARGFPEKRVQSLVIAYLAREGWTLTSEANTDSREHGIDVVAERNGQTVGIEVKGYPGTDYSDPRRAGEVKISHPSAQAGTYFAQAVLTAMRLRSRRPDMISVIAVPDVPRYRSLVTEITGSLEAARIVVWLVNEDGDVAVAVSGSDPH